MNAPPRPEPEVPRRSWLDKVHDTWPALILLIGLAAAITINVTSSEDETGKHRSVTIRIDGKDAGHKPDQGDPVMRVPAVAVQQAQATELGDHEGLKSEVPVGVPNAQLDAAQEQQDRLAQNDQLPPVLPDAAPSQAGCRSRFVGNFSSRRGVAPRIIVIHYTVSPNRPGWSDVDGVTGLFARFSFAASSNYVEDREGHCNYIVREGDKAWAQATFNPVAISIEVINSGREGSLTSGAGLRQLQRIVRDAGKRWKIPLRVGAVSGCTVTRSGIVTHQMLGACGGGHVDISPYKLSVVLGGLAPRPVTNTDRVTCRKLNWWRRHGRHHGKAERNASRRRRALASRGVTCTPSGPVRR